MGMILDVTPGDHEGFERHLLEGMGHQVEVCHGPDGHQRCPLIEEGTCELVKRAHGVVFKLDLDRPYHRTILERYKAVLGDTPIAVAVRPGQDDEYPELLDGVYLWNHQPTSAELDGFAALVEASDRIR
jgi:hypothetical protein